MRAMTTVFPPVSSVLGELRTFWCHLSAGVTARFVPLSFAQGCAGNFFIKISIWAIWEWILIPARILLIVTYSFVTCCKFFPVSLFFFYFAYYGHLSWKILNCIVKCIFPIITSGYGVIGNIFLLPGYKGINLHFLLEFIWVSFLTARFMIYLGFIFYTKS